VTSVSKKPKPDFVVRLVAPQLRPWAVPMRRLTRALEAVQRLMEQGDETADDLGDLAFLTGEEVAPENEPAVSLRLIDVKSSSAAYQVASSDPTYAIETLARTGKAIGAPQEAEWPSQVLSSLRDLSDIAKAMSCQIEFRRPGCGRQHGPVLAVVEGDTYRQVSGSAFASGPTSILGRVERVGGATAMHCGLRVSSQPRKMVICRVSTPDLVRALGNYLYQDVVVSGMATWVRHDWRLRNLVIHDFEPPKTGSIMTALKQIHAAGGSAWDEVDDPGAEIAEMRG